MGDNGLETAPWGEFVLNETSGITFPLHGEFNWYPGNGYLYKIGNQLGNITSINNTISSMASNKYIDNSTLAISYILGGYILDIDFFFSINLGLEKTRAGSYKVIENKVELFRPWLFWNNKKILVLGIWVLLSMILVIIIFIKEAKRKYAKGTLCKFVLHIRAFLLYLLWIFCLAYFITELITVIVYGGTNFFPSDDSYVELRWLSYLFIIKLRLMATFAGILVLNLCMMINYNLTNKFSVIVLDKVIKNNVKYFMPLWIVIFGLSLLGYIINGPYSRLWYNYHRCVLEVLLAGIGRFNSGDSIWYNAEGSVAFYTILYLFQVFFTFSIFTCFLFQGYYEVVMRHGFYTPVFRKITFIDILKFWLFWTDDSSYIMKDDR